MDFVKNDDQFFNDTLKKKVNIEDLIIDDDDVELL